MTKVNQIISFESIKKYLLEKGMDFTHEVGHNYGEDEQIIVIDQEVEEIGLLDATIIINNTEKSFRVDELFHLKQDDKGRYFRDEEVNDPDGMIQCKFFDAIIMKSLES
jgi:hypothetical protein